MGFARSQRRATKHASDLLDVYRLVDRYHPPGQLVRQLHRAPGHISAVIDSIVRAEYLVNPVKAAASMASTQGTAISPDDVAQTMDAFVEDLEDPRVPDDQEILASVKAWPEAAGRRCPRAR